MAGQVLPQGEAAGYEVALDVLAELIGHASARIREEQVKRPPNTVEAELWRRRRDNWASRRRELDPRDREAIREVLDRDAAFLRSLTEGGV